MIKKTIRVKHTDGIHARPASAIVELTSQFKCEIEIIKENIPANAKSILNLIMLAIEYNCKIDIITDGEDEKVAMEAIISLFDKNFNIA